MRFPLNFDIAGVKYHYKSNWPNKFNGYVQPEKDNKYDSQAIAIYNDNTELVGYIPRDQTRNLRVWAGGDFTKLPCEIRLDISLQYDIYNGCVVVHDNIDEDYKENSYQGKNIFIKSVNGGRRFVHDMLYASGAIKNAQLKKATDFVVCVDDQAKAEFPAPKDSTWHYEVITDKEFLQGIIPKDKQNPLIFNKVISPETQRESFFAQLLEKYLISEGAIYRPRYNKRETEVVIRWSVFNETNTLNKAISDGKEIINAEDVLPYAYKKLEVIDLSEPSYDTSTPITITFKSTAKSNQNKGCILIMIMLIAGAVAAFASIL